MSEYEFYKEPLNPTIVFHDKINSEVGRLAFNGGIMSFTGNADESALTFLDFIRKSYASDYTRLVDENYTLKRRVDELEIRLDSEERDSEGNTRRWFIGDRVLVGPNGMIATVIKQRLHFDGPHSFFGNVDLMYDDGVKGESNSWQLKDADE
jgi:hypothetical protein